MAGERLGGWKSGIGRRERAISCGGGGGGSGQPRLPLSSGEFIDRLFNEATERKERADARREMLRNAERNRLEMERRTGPRSEAADGGRYSGQGWGGQGASYLLVKQPNRAC